MSNYDQVTATLKHAIFEQGIEPGKAIDVMRELFDDIAPETRTEFAKRRVQGTTPTLDEFRINMVYGGDANPKSCEALYNTLVHLSAGKQNQSDARDVFAKVNDGIDKIMVEFRDYPDQFFDGFDQEEPPEAPSQVYSL